MVAVTQLLHRNNRKAADAARPFTDDDLDPGDTFFSQSLSAGPLPRSSSFGSRTVSHSWAHLHASGRPDEGCLCAFCFTKIQHLPDKQLTPLSHPFRLGKNPILKTH
jgi:hypothetical protein